jgi:hypothetical protein
MSQRAGEQLFLNWEIPFRGEQKPPYSAQVSESQKNQAISNT